MTTDLWHWRAVYKDGSLVDEYDEHGQARGFLTISQDQLTHFLLVSQDEAIVPHHVLQRGSPEATVLFRRRRQIATSLDTGEQTTGPTVTIVGLEQDGVSQYVFFFEDGSTLFCADIDAV